MDSLSDTKPMASSVGFPIIMSSVEPWTTQKPKGLVVCFKGDSLKVTLI